MLKLIRRYLRLMRDHDFSYCFSDDFEFWQREDKKRINLIMLRSAMVLTPKGRWFVKRAEKKYGHV